MHYLAVDQQINVRKDEKCSIWYSKAVVIRLFGSWILCIDLFKLFTSSTSAVPKRIVEGFPKKGRNDLFRLNGFGLKEVL